VAVVVADDEAGVRLLDGPGRWEAAAYGSAMDWGAFGSNAPRLVTMIAGVNEEPAVMTFFPSSR
jgi:hypothetical protein